MSTEDLTLPEAPLSLHNRRLRGRPKYPIERTRLKQWTDKKALLSEDKTLLFWFHDWAANQDLDLESLGKQLKQPNGQPYSKDSVYQAMTGRRNGVPLRNFMDAVAELRKQEAERSSLAVTGFVETDLARRVWQVCDATRNFGKMGYLIGETHIGKTVPLKQYARRNSGNTVYVRMPHSGARSHFIRRLAQRVHLSVTGNDHTIISNLHQSLNKETLLIIDEYHCCLPLTERELQRGISKTTFNMVECIRELHDETGMPILMVVTPVFDHVMKDAAFARVVKQTMQRRIATFRLPDRASPEDLAAFAKHYGLGRATGSALDLQNHVIAQESLGRWLTLLQGAAKLANTWKQPIGWEHVLQSNAALLALENGN